MKRPSKTPPPSSARLFSESQGAAAPPAGVHIANIDGASRGNPGPASYGVILRNADGQVVLKLAKDIGRATNNVAEYYALLSVLDFAVTHEINSLRVRSDSELLVRQIQGRYKVKSADLKPLHELALKIVPRLKYFAIEHVPREMNRDADALANVALDQAIEPKGEEDAFDIEREPAVYESKVPKSERIRPFPPATNASRSTNGPLRIRARLVKGVLVPIEPLDLPENTEIAIEFRIIPSDKS